MGYKLRQFWWGGALNAPPLKSLKMKLQSHVRGQNRGSWVCPVHLDYFQVADMCISRGFKWFQSQSLSKANFWLFYTFCLLHALSTENVHGSTVAIWGWFRMTQHIKIPLFWHLIYSHSLKTIQVTERACYVLQHTLKCANMHGKQNKINYMYWNEFRNCFWT